MMIDEPRPNLELLRSVLRQIDAQPETWNQEHIAIPTSCGTAYCVAGWGVILAGHQIRFDADGNAILDDDPWASIWVCAVDEFGIDEDEAWGLFYSDNTRDDIERLATEIAARAGEPLWPEDKTP